MPVLSLGKLFSRVVVFAASSSSSNSCTYKCLACLKAIIIIRQEKGLDCSDHDLVVLQFQLNGLIFSISLSGVFAKIFRCIKNIDPSRA